MSEVEETFNRIRVRSGVDGLLIVTHDGRPHRSTMDKQKEERYAYRITQLANKAKSLIRDIDPENDLTFMRVRCRKYEIMVAPGKDFYLIVKQDVPTEEKTV